MNNIYNYDFFIFDCDGVILESNKLKSDAFSEALPNEPSHLVEEFISYHKNNGGVSRYEKFKYYFEILFSFDSLLSIILLTIIFLIIIYLIKKVNFKIE